MCCQSAFHEVGHAVLNVPAISQTRSAVYPHHTEWIIQLSILQQFHRLEVQSIRIIRNGSYSSQSSKNISDYTYSQSASHAVDHVVLNIPTLSQIKNAGNPHRLKRNTLLIKGVTQVRCALNRHPLKSIKHF
jgi:hypothetical protein